MILLHFFPPVVAVGGIQSVFCDVGNHVPVAYLINFAYYNKSSLPVGIFKNTPVKRDLTRWKVDACWKDSAWEKKNLPEKILDACWKNCAREKKNLPEKILNFLPEKKKVPPRKNTKKSPRKFQTAREKFNKSGRDKKFLPETKNKKSAKNRCLGHFSFSRVKKNTGSR